MLGPESSLDQISLGPRQHTEHACVRACVCARVHAARMRALNTLTYTHVSITNLSCVCHARTFSCACASAFACARDHTVGATQTIKNPTLSHPHPSTGGSSAPVSHSPHPHGGRGRGSNPTHNHKRRGEGGPSDLQSDMARICAHTAIYGLHFRSPKK